MDRTSRWSTASSSMWTVKPQCPEPLESLQFSVLLLNLTHKLHDERHRTSSSSSQLKQATCATTIALHESSGTHKRAPDTCGLLSPSHEPNILTSRCHQKGTQLEVRVAHLRTLTLRKDCCQRHQDRSDDAGDGGHASQRAFYPEHRQDHKLKSDARGDSRHENTTVHRQSTIANAARSESEEQGQGQRQQGQRQRQGRQEQRHGHGCKERRPEKVLPLQQVRLRECRVQKETVRLCRCGGDTGGRVATHPNHTAAVVPLQCLLPGERRTHVNVRHSHALCEQRHVMRAFQ